MSAGAASALQCATDMVAACSSQLDKAAAAAAWPAPSGEQPQPGSPPQLAEAASLSRLALSELARVEKAFADALRGEHAVAEALQAALQQAEARAARVPQARTVTQAPPFGPQPRSGRLPLPLCIC